MVPPPGVVLGSGNPRCGAGQAALGWVCYRGHEERDGDRVDVGPIHRAGAGPVQTPGPRTCRCSLQSRRRGLGQSDPRSVTSGDRQGGDSKGWWPLPRHRGGDLLWAWTGDTEKPPAGDVEAQAWCEDAWGRQWPPPPPGRPPHAEEAQIPGPAGRSSPPRAGVAHSGPLTDPHARLTPRDETPSILYQSPLLRHRPHSG